MKWNARSQIFRTMPWRSYFLFCVAVAFTFATVGVVNDLFDLSRTDGLHLMLKIVTTSGFSVLWVIAIHRRTAKFLALVIAIQVVWMIGSARLFPAHQRNLSPSEWQSEVALHAFLIFILILFSYGWFGTFFQAEGKRYYTAHTEIELASQIQKQLVPPIDVVRGNVEIHGISRPSGTICAYVADIAGHGVAAGVMMSMVKTAVRMHLQTGSATGLMEALNDTLAPLTEPTAYATIASVILEPDSATRYAVAAHLPILHYQRASSTVQRHTMENFPVAMFAGVTYETASLEFANGDILAIVTDGLTEVFNSRQQELGESYIEETLIRLGAEPLPVIAESILETAHRFGKAVDDQTLLLIRRRGAS
jgi:hypothetical protein